MGLAGTWGWLALALWGTSAQAEGPILSWDQELAFDFDRGQYEDSLRQIVAQGYAAASSFLGHERAGRLHVTIYTRDRYEKVFGAEAERRQGAHYSRGGIHVNGGNRLDGSFSGEMAHEMTHAVLDYRGTAHRLPAWFNEGLAERVAFRLRGLDGLATNQAQELKSSAEHGTLGPLQNREPLSPFGYLQAYSAVWFVETRFGREALLRIADRTLQGEAFESALRAETRWSIAELEREWIAWTERLLG